ncbi:MAG: sulfatase [Planctomycetaceae bacterium]|nr:sulfatase [Planctomycetaceae bacterium]
MPNRRNVGLPSRFVAMSFIAVVLGLCGKTQAAGGAQPNIVVFVADDLGWSDLGYSGSSFYESPNIDALSKRSMVFTNAYANGPNCAPSRASLMSGMYTPRHGIYTVASSARGKSKDRRLVPTENTTVLRDEITTIPEELRALGYRTGHFGKWHLGPDPKTQGMDVNIAGREWGSPSGGGYRSPFAFPNLKSDEPGEYLTDRISEAACDFIRSSKGKPFFVYLSHYSVHTPIQPKNEYVEHFKNKPGDRGHNNSGYASMIRSLDESMGRIIQTLDDLSLSDNTIVIFVSDNGGHGGVTSNRPLRGAKGMLYEGGIRVPMIVHWPGKTSAGTKFTQPVIGVDLMPTILEMAAIKSAVGLKNQPRDGISLVNVLDGSAERIVNRPVFWHFPAYLQGTGGGTSADPFRTRPAGAVRLGDWKLIEFFETGQIELYNLADDISESKNLAASNSDRAALLLGKLRSWRSTIGAPVPTEANPDYED